MKNKKYIIIGIVIIIIVAIISGIYKITSTYLFEENNGIPNNHNELINHLKNIEDNNERKIQIDYSVNKNFITQQEANELY